MILGNLKWDFGRQAKVYDAGYVIQIRISRPSIHHPSKTELEKKKTDVIRISI